MKNISFDNPLWLLLFIPLAAAVLIPYFIAKNKDNGNFGWKISLVIHLVIAALVSLAAAGMMSVSVLTKTTVYVVADVSYSSDRNLDEIDEYISEIQNSLPQNSALGVVCFGNDCVLLTPAGKSIKPVAEARVDNSATDIVGALTYTEGLFSGDEIKRIVLITDGNDTINDGSGAIASVIERLKENDIKLDAIFLDNTLNTLKQDECEVQLSSVEYSKSTYLGHSSVAKAVIQSSAATNALLELHSRPFGSSEEFARVDYTVISVESGVTTVNVTLPTSESGEFEYRITITPDEDISDHNNSQSFIQSVAEKMNVLLLTGRSTDVTTIKAAYSNKANIDSYVVTKENDDVPFRLEELSLYDEIIVSNLDIRLINNVNALIDSLDIAVSQYGKSLIAVGNLEIQDKDDPVLEKFEELLPVNYGNTNNKGKLYTIVLDISHSMFQASRFFAAKDAAVKLISLLDDEDEICLVTFSGDVKVNFPPTLLSDCRREVIAFIDGLKTYQGTYIGGGLKSALDAIELNDASEKQVMLISDGVSFTNEKENSFDVAKRLKDAGITVSTINTVNINDSSASANLSTIASLGGGKYFPLAQPEGVTELVFAEVAETVTNSVITEQSAVKIERPTDDINKGFSSYPKVSGFVQSSPKYDAIVPIYVMYQKTKSYSVPVPLYAYRSHGNGTVVSYTSSLTGWMAGWGTELKERFIENMISSATPSERINHPYTVKFENRGKDTYLEIIPSVLNPEAKATLQITFPSGRTITRTLSFDSQKYFFTFETLTEGTYTVKITYSYDENEFSSVSYLQIPYLDEYNAFDNFDKATVYKFMRGAGSISEGEIPSLENDEGDIATYKLSYRIPLLIIAAVLFIIDIIVRKLKWSDIHSFFEKKRRKKGEKL